MEYEKINPLFRIPDSILIYAFQLSLPEQRFKLTHFNFNLNINILQYPPENFSISLQNFRKNWKRGLDNKNR